MKTNEFVDFIVHDVLSRVEGVTYRAMFGGYGLYIDGLMFGLLAYDQLYFKVDKKSMKEYEEAGSKPFSYTQRGKKSVTMSYWLVPGEIIEDKEAVAQWALRSYDIQRGKK